ncbi:MAG: glutaredoxin family protein [Thermomicrobiales bacterium]
MTDQKSEILFYGRTRFCPDVARSRARLTELSIEWNEFDIEADEDAAQRAEALTGFRRVPTIVIGDKVLVEPTNTALDEALVAAGYDLTEDQ